ncbi:MAG: sigma-70 family RNA polymerase sigma factor [Burkholderiaceae bacterium]
MGASDCSLSPLVETLYSDHHGWLEDWLRRKLGDSFVAADLAQDAFVSVIAAGSAGQIREPRPFLATIARRLVAHHHRRRVLEEAYLQVLAGLPEDMAPSPESQYLALEALREIDRALDGLPPLVREAFLLAHFEELGYADIAVRLKVSTSSVKQYLTRAHRHCLFALSA